MPMYMMAQCFLNKEDFLDYLDLEGMGVFTVHGVENGFTIKLKELKGFGMFLK